MDKKTTIRIIYNEDAEVALEEELTIPEHFMWMWKIFIDCMITAAAKNHDYSQGEKWHHNFSGGGLKGIVNRMQDKFMRLVNQIKGSPAEVKDESFKDTCMDLATYAILLYGAKRDGLSLDGDLWKENENETE